MNALRLIGLVVLLCVLSMAYLFQRDLSLRLATRQARQATLTRVLSEQRDRLAVEVARLTGFGYLDSICGLVGRSAPGRGGAGIRVGDAGVEFGHEVAESPPAVAAVVPGDGR